MREGTGVSFGENHDGQLGRDAAGRIDGTPAPISAPGVRRGPRKMLELMSLVSQDPRRLDACLHWLGPAADESLRVHYLYYGPIIYYGYEPRAPRR